jgi:hypothetical protein
MYSIPLFPLKLLGLIRHYFEDVQWWLVSWLGKAWWNPQVLGNPFPVRNIPIHGQGPGAATDSLRLVDGDIMLYPRIPN